MRLLFAIKSAGVAGGGAERVCSQVVAGLVDRGHDVTMLTFDPPGADTFYDFPDGIAWHRLGVGVPGRSVPRGAFVRALPRLRRVVRQVAPDVAVAFMHSMYVPLGVALAGTGVPMVASEHQVADYYARRPAQRRLLGLLPALAGEVTTTSRAVADSFGPRLARHMTVVPNPVPEIAPDGRRPPQDPTTADGVVLAMGRFEEQKDHRTLLRAFARLAVDHPGWRLRILGDGSLRPALEDEVADLGLGDRVELPGTTTDVTAAYRQATVFAIPSVFESFGLVTAEALAHGVPVVGFADCPGTNELVQHGHNGLLVAGPDRVTALADGLRRMVEDGALRERLARQAHPSLARFDRGAILDTWEALLGECAAPAGTGAPRGG